MGINILDIFAGGWHKKLVPIEKGVCYDTWLRHSCNPFLESCASWIFCWPSRRVNNNSLIFWSFSQGRSIVEIKFLFLYCYFRFLLIFIYDLFLKTINRRDWLECILLHDPPFPAADPSDPPTAAKQPSGKVTRMMLVKKKHQRWRWHRTLNYLHCLPNTLYTLIHRCQTTFWQDNDDNVGNIPYVLWGKD